MCNLYVMQILIRQENGLGQIKNFLLVANEGSLTDASKRLTYRNLLLADK